MTWTAWTEASEATLRERWLAGDSAGQIAALIGATRNAVVGKVHRLGLDGRRCDTGAEVPKRKTLHVPKAPRATAPRRIAPAVAAKPPAPHTPAPAVPRHVEPRRLADLGSRQCHFIVGDPGPGEMHHALFCADHTPEGSAYCEAHRAVCYQPTDLERQRARRAKARETRARLAA